MLSSIHLYINKGSFKYFIKYITKTNSFPIPSCIKLSQTNGYIWDKVYLKESLIVNQCIRMNTLKLK